MLKDVRITEIYRHIKTGGLYLVLCDDAKMQAKDWFRDIHKNDQIIYDEQVDMEPVVVYTSLKDHKVWVRPTEEFMERFEVVTDA